MTQLTAEPLACADVRELLGNAVDGELTEAMLARVTGHLSGCPGCRAEHAGLTRLAAWLRGSAAPASGEGARPTAWFAARLLARVEAEAERGGGAADAAERAAPGQLPLWR